MSGVPTVSIVIPAYNAAGTIAETLDSIERQTCGDYETIIVDDASVDATRQVVERRNHECRVLCLDKNSGPAAARNRGIGEARGTWIAFLDADDTWLPKRLETQLRLARREPDVGMWCGGTVAYGGARSDDEDRVPGARKISIRDLAVRNPIATSSVLVKKDALEAVGGFDESFCGPEDYDLWIRIAAKYPVKCVEAPVARYRERSGSLSMDDRRFMPEVLRVIQKAYGPNGALAGHSHLRKAALMYQYDHAAWMAFCRGARWTALRWLARAQFVSLTSMRTTGHSAPPLLKHLYQYLLRNPPGRKSVAKRLFEDIQTIRRMPRAAINLMSAEANDNDLFYRDLVNDYYDETRKRHPRFALVRALSFGMTLCRLPANKDEYFAMLEASARRNFKKAKRLGYTFDAIDFNEHLEEIAEIRCSTNERQGRMPEELLSGKVEPCRNPVSRTNIHDYPYFGVRSKEGRLVAYAGCFVAGEACLVEHILGHAQFQRDGIVPMLVTGIAGYVMDHYPKVKYYGYGTYFGAGESLRRFKRKLGFQPHWVEWKK